MNKYVFRTSLVWIAILAVLAGIWEYRSRLAKQPRTMNMPMSGDVQPVASGPPPGVNETTPSMPEGRSRCWRRCTSKRGAVIGDNVAARRCRSSFISSLISSMTARILAFMRSISSSHAELTVAAPWLPPVALAIDPVEDVAVVVRLPHHAGYPMERPEARMSASFAGLRPPGFGNGGNVVAVPVAGTGGGTVAVAKVGGWIARGARTVFGESICSRCATSTSKRSPPRWPTASLTSLNPSSPRKAKVTT